MKYIVENFDTCEDVAVFDTEEERNEWLKRNTVLFTDHFTGEDYCFTYKTNIRIAIYER